MSISEVVADRYELGPLLGSGGMADVHRAHDRLLQRDVAVKVLRDHTDGETDRARFVSEARTLAGLSHRGLVTILDAGITEARPFLVMELVEAPTLADLVARGPVPLERVREIGVPLAEALSYAHGRGVVHRDVKPGNVLVPADGRVKLVDFGIARLVGETTGHTRTGTAIGTAAYLAPEQVTGDDVSGATDVYALGLLLLELLTAERAYPGPPTEAALARLHRPPDIPADLPATWRHLLSSMTAQTPAGRPAAAEVATQLRRLDPTAAPPAAVDREPTVVRVPAATATQVLTDHVPEPAPAPPTHGRAAAVWRQTSSTTRALLGVAAVFVLLLVAVALAADSGRTTRSPVPAETPDELRPALTELHDAVEGG